MLAALADLGAPRDGVPGHFGPLDIRLCCHLLGFFYRVRAKWAAIFSAVDPRLGFAAAKQSAYIGDLFEL